VITNIVQNMDGGSVTINAGGNVILDSDINLTGAGQIIFNIDGTLTLNQAITSDSGAITLNAGQGLIFSENGDISSISGNVCLNAGSGSLTMTGETFIDAGSGIIDIDAASDITLGKLKTSSSENLRNNKYRWRNH
jgi:hypothetical protein